jgi:hypothetical protein
MSFAAEQKHIALLERASLVTKRVGRRKVVRTNLEGLRVARRLPDRYEEVARPHRPHDRGCHRVHQGEKSMTMTVTTLAQAAAPRT